MVDHSITLTKAYSSALIYYVALLELKHVYHGTATTFAKIKVVKVDLTISVQKK